MTSITERLATLEQDGIEYDKEFVSDKLAEMNSVETPMEKHKIHEYIQNYLNLVYFYN